MNSTCKVKSSLFLSIIILIGATLATSGFPLSAQSQVISPNDATCNQFDDLKVVKAELEKRLLDDFAKSLTNLYYKIKNTQKDQYPNINTKNQLESWQRLYGCVDLKNDPTDQDVAAQELIKVRKAIRVKLIEIQTLLKLTENGFSPDNIRSIQNILGESQDGELGSSTLQKYQDKHKTLASQINTEINKLSSMSPIVIKGKTDPTPKPDYLKNEPDNEVTLSFSDAFSRNINLLLLILLVSTCMSVITFLISKEIYYKPLLDKILSDQKSNMASELEKIKAEFSEKNDQNIAYINKVVEDKLRTKETTTGEVIDPVPVPVIIDPVPVVIDSSPQVKQQQGIGVAETPDSINNRRSDSSLFPSFHAPDSSLKTNYLIINNNQLVPKEDSTFNQYSLATLKAAFHCEQKGNGSSITVEKPATVVSENNQWRVTDKGRIILS